MEVKDLQREMMMTEIIGERDAQVLELNSMVAQGKQQIDQLQKQIDQMKSQHAAEIMALQCPVPPPEAQPAAEIP